MVKKSDFPKTAKGNIIRLDDLSDPSVRHEEAGPADRQHSLRAMDKPMSPWKVPGVLLRLTQYAKQFLTAAQIAARLNHEFSLQLSRKAVIGALNRNGLAINQLKPQPKNNPGNRNSPKVLQLQTRLKELTLVEPQPRGDVSDGCRYLHGDAAQRNFCGDKVATGAWCAYHRKKVYHANDYTRKAETNWRRTI